MYKYKLYVVCTGMVSDKIAFFIATSNNIEF